MPFASRYGKMNITNTINNIAIIKGGVTIFLMLLAASLSFQFTLRSLIIEVAKV